VRVNNDTGGCMRYRRRWPAWRHRICLVSYRDFFTVRRQLVSTLCLCCTHRSQSG